VFLSFVFFFLGGGGVSSSSPKKIQKKMSQICRLFQRFQVMVPDDASAEDIIMHRESSGLYQVEWTGGEVMSFEVDFCLILLMAEIRRAPVEVGS